MALSICFCFRLCLQVFCWRKSIGRPPVKIPFDYSEREVTVSEVDGIQIYVASKTDQVGYHYFPGVPNQGRLDVIELRTDKLEDGFRLKEEYRDQNIIPDGRVVD